MFAFVPTLDSRNAFVDLLQNILARQPSAGAKTAIVAKCASSDSNRAVDIWAGETRIDTHSLDTKSENLF